MNTFRLFDRMARASAASAPARPIWQVATAAAVAGLWSAIPSRSASAQTAVPAAETCVPVNSDTSCPPDTEKKPKPGNQPTANGCGPEGGSITIPQGYGDADYTTPCNHHDFCYEDCAIGKDSCDETFRDEMYDACAAAYPGAFKALLRFGCYERAYAYYQAVSQFGGDAYSAAQTKACQCCKESTKVYCNCNKTCYDSVSVCLNECEVSLGCFTGICGPATADQCPA